MAGAANQKKFSSNAPYREAAFAYNQCQLYAHSYAMTMVERVKAENPEFLEEKGMS